MTDSPQPTRQDEYFLDTPQIRDFIAEVRRTVAQHNDVSAALDALQGRFAALLAHQEWLPDAFAMPYEKSRMGGGIGTWLMFRAADHSLSLFSLVVPPGAETPVHDHLAWGFVGLYRGIQNETVYRRVDDGSQEGYARLEVTAIHSLSPGDFYKLLPPDGDIHSVQTTSDTPSISIHLLANDTGCVVRHAFQPENDHVHSFRSGYSNMPCVEDRSKESE